MTVVKLVETYRAMYRMQYWNNQVLKAACSAIIRCTFSFNLNFSRWSSCIFSFQRSMANVIYRYLITLSSISSWSITGRTHRKSHWSLPTPQKSKTSDSLIAVWAVNCKVVNWRVRILNFHISWLMRYPTAGWVESYYSWAFLFLKLYGPLKHRPQNCWSERIYININCIKHKIASCLQLVDRQKKMSTPKILRLRSAGFLLSDQD